MSGKLIFFYYSHFVLIYYTKLFKKISRATITGLISFGTFVNLGFNYWYIKKSLAAKISPGPGSSYDVYSSYSG
jgi:hypothetical protein